MFVGCCVPCYGVVVNGAKIKNRVFYKEYVEGEFRKPPPFEKMVKREGKKERKKEGKQNEGFSMKSEESEFEIILGSDDQFEFEDKNLLHVIRMSTEPFFRGLPIVFDDDFPEETLGKRIQGDEFNMTIININYIIDKNTPCTGWMVCLSLLCCPTFGLSLIPMFTCGSKTVNLIRAFLDEENEKVYKKYGVFWRLMIIDDGKKTLSWIEIRNIEKNKELVVS